MARQTRAQAVDPETGYYASRLLATLVSGKNPDDTNFSLRTVSGQDTVLGYQQITSLGTVQTLTVPSGATKALIQCTGQPIRWRDDGNAPTATVGMRITVGETLEYKGNLSAIRFIQEAASGVLNVSYYSN